jgi:proline iminopeptidase
MAFARLVTHYWRHTAWLQDGVLLRDAPKLAGIPGVLAHGRLDISGPPDIAWNLAQVWPDATLTLIDQAGHGTQHTDMTQELRAAIDRFATRH